MTLKVMKFEAEWCGPCKALTPVWERVVDATDDVEFVVVDIDKEPDTAAEYSVRAIPTIVFIKDGEQVDNIIGLRPADEITAKIEEWKSE